VRPGSTTSLEKLTWLRVDRAQIPVAMALTLPHAYFRWFVLIVLHGDLIIAFLCII
jgi:hypothetical protein